MQERVQSLKSSWWSGTWWRLRVETKFLGISGGWLLSELKYIIYASLGGLSPSPVPVTLLMAIPLKQRTLTSLLQLILKVWQLAQSPTQAMAQSLGRLPQWLQELAIGRQPLPLRLSTLFVLWQKWPLHQHPFLYYHSVHEVCPGLHHLPHLCRCGPCTWGPPGDCHCHSINDRKTGGQELPGDEPGSSVDLSSASIICSDKIDPQTHNRTHVWCDNQIYVADTWQTEKPTPCLKLWNLGLLIQDNNTV